MPNRRILEIADRFEPRIRTALLGAFMQIQQRTTLAEALRQFESRGIEGIMSLLDNIETDLSGEFSDELENAIRDSGRVSIELMPRQAVIGPFNYSTFNLATAAAIREYELNLIQQISNESREAVRRGVQADIIAGRSPRATARTFRANIGLTVNQEQAVRNYRTFLETLDRQALERALRDRRFDRTILNAIQNDRPLRRDQIDRMVQRYRERLIAHRSTVIARTESLRAVSIGNHTAVQQMLEVGAVDGQRVRRFWVYTRDARTRAAHRRVPSLNPEGVDLNEPFVTPLGPLRFPRDPNGTGANTIQCRCTVDYRLVEAA